MPERAEVTSVEAIASFRTRLVLYVSKARPALEEVSAEVLRTRLWLQNEQRVLLEGQVRRRERELVEAQQALFSGRMASLRAQNQNQTRWMMSLRAQNQNQMWMTSLRARPSRRQNQTQKTTVTPSLRASGATTRSSPRSGEW